VPSEREFQKVITTYQPQGKPQQHQTPSPQ
jgi:hypothetical protein